MEKTIKLYSQRAISIATFFGGPVVAGFLIKKNYEALNQKKAGKKAFLIGIVSTILLFAGIFSIPEHFFEKVPNIVIPAIYTGIIYLIVDTIQGEWLKEHKENGGEFYSRWKAAGIGAIFMVILFALIIGAGFIYGDLAKLNFDAAAYDKEVAVFAENEKKAIAVLEVINPTIPIYSIKELSKANVLWKENKDIIFKLDSIENLPAELLEQNKRLLIYCDLRIQYNELLVKAFSENTDIYDSDIDRIGVELNKILEEINTDVSL